VRVDLPARCVMAVVETTAKLSTSVDTRHCPEEPEPTAGMASASILLVTSGQEGPNVSALAEMNDQNVTNDPNFAPIHSVTQVPILIRLAEICERVSALDKREPSATDQDVRVVVKSDPGTL
jgi:hypothetical protein